jgi:hypothetical protein
MNRPALNSSRRPWALVALVLALSAFASTPAHAETLWARVAVDGARWPDAPTPVSVHLVLNDEVEVLAKQGARVRVRKGTDFGWVDAAALTDVAPPVVAPTGGLPGEPMGAP